MQKRKQQTTKKRSKHNRVGHSKFVRLAAALAVLCTVVTLHMPVLALEGAKTPCELDHTHGPSCGIAAVPAKTRNLEGKVLHTHNKYCRNSEGRVICPLPELEEHVHSDSCYQIPTQETVPAEQGHVHTEECYTNERGALICTIQEQSGHVHTDACYEVVAGTTEKVHEHTGDCYTKEKGKLTCTRPESEGHAHGGACYVSSGVLNCTKEENEEHTHGDSCYGKTLICETAEAAGHAHSDGCFEWTEVLSCNAGVSSPNAQPGKVLVCTEKEQPVHVHEDTCYAWTKVLSCTKEELPGGSTVPAESEKVLICSKMEVIRHTHNAACYEPSRLGKGKLICGQYQLEEHQHTEGCLDLTGAELICEEKENNEHRHNYLCYRSWTFLCQSTEKTGSKIKSNPAADVETAEIWEKTFEHVELTGAWSQDLLAIAQTQLGYEESERNFTVSKEGIRKGYTRYGEWYGGVEYGDWCAMFIAFCMHYAGVEGVPVSCSCELWTDLLEEAGLYAAVDTYTPRPGDFVFFDSSRTLATPETVPVASDHVGIVVEVIPATQEEPAAVMTIEGNYYDCVRYETRYLDDPRIVGYGLLPDGPAATYSCGLKTHNHGADCYDETGNLLCKLQNHTHDESCRIRKLQYSDESVSVDMTLSNAVYLPADLRLRVTPVTKNDEDIYDAMIASVGEAMSESAPSLEDALLFRTDFLSNGQPYELPAGVHAQIRVSFKKPMFAAKSASEAVQRHTFALIEEKSEEDAASASYHAVQVTACDYENTDNGIMGVTFAADRICAFSIVVNPNQRAAQKNTLPHDLLGAILQ